MPRGITHRAYPPEFRAEAVRLVREGGRTPRELAADLGCSEESIRNWLKQADLDAGRRHDGLTTEEREELRRLRSENRVLRMERDLLKKAAAFFAQDSAPTR
jgi:transposase